MYAQTNIPIRARLWLSLLLGVLGAALIASPAGAASPAPEAANAASAAAEPVVTAATSVAATAAESPPATPAADPAPAPASEASSPASESSPVSSAAATPAPVTKAAAGLVGSATRSAGSPPDAASAVVRRSVERVAETTATVGSATHVAAVDETTRRVAAAGSTGADAIGHIAPGQQAGAAVSAPDSGEARAVEQGSREREIAGPLPPLPSMPDRVEAFAAPRIDLGLIAAAGTATGGGLLTVATSLPAVADLQAEAAPSAPTHPRPDGGLRLRSEGPPAPPPAAATAASTPGGGFGFSIFLLGVLALFALLAPKTPPRLLRAGPRHGSAAFVCALERPG
jgi:hypothetical protein